MASCDVHMGHARVIREPSEPKHRSDTLLARLSCAHRVRGCSIDVQRTFAHSTRPEGMNPTIATKRITVRSCHYAHMIDMVHVYGESGVPTSADDVRMMR